MRLSATASSSLRTRVDYFLCRFTRHGHQWIDGMQHFVEILSWNGCFTSSLHGGRGSRLR
jgi:hypothetical protein